MTFKGVLSLAGRLRGKPISVILFRAIQLLHLSLLRYVGAWKRFDARSSRRWGNDAFVREFAHRLAGNEQLLITREGLRAARVHLERHADGAKLMADERDRALRGEIDIFGQTVEFGSLSTLPWSTDWRFGHTWDNEFYLLYNHYDFNRSQPYDVRVPWELSRLSFLLVPTISAACSNDSTWWPVLRSLLENWSKQNPLAHSVNWKPMECSMRCVNLVIMVLLACQAGPPGRQALPIMLRLCETHGRFIYRNIEYSSPRGNHYAANLAALLLAGLLLKGTLREAGRWLNYAQSRADGEIQLQFSDDGIQIEKSIPYHRLVTELFLICLIARERAGLEVRSDARDRLRAACHYVREYTRPDGSTPVWGDNDDARVLSFDSKDPNDHRALLALAGDYFGDESLSPMEARSICVPLLLGKIQEQAPSQNVKEELAASYFPKGGMFVARHGLNCFVADIGEVGMHGRGGHGHNDTLSFELVLEGQPLIIDPGSYVYTGDISQRNRFRSTAAHNVARIDGEEMATLYEREIWRLGDEATPHAIAYITKGNYLELRASHRGYCRLPDPVNYERTWRMDAAKGVLRIQDSFECEGAHESERFFHFAPELAFDMKAHNLEVTVIGCPSLRFLLTWEDGTKARLDDDWVSKHYGHKARSKTLVLRNSLKGPTTLQAEIRFQGRSD